MIFAKQQKKSSPQWHFTDQYNGKSIIEKSFTNSYVTPIEWLNEFERLCLHTQTFELILPLNINDKMFYIEHVLKMLKLDISWKTNLKKNTRISSAVCVLFYGWPAMESLQTSNGWCMLIENRTCIIAKALNCTKIIEQMRLKSLNYIYNGFPMSFNGNFNRWHRITHIHHIVPQHTRTHMLQQQLYKQQICIQTNFNWTIISWRTALGRSGRAMPTAHR